MIDMKRTASEMARDSGYLCGPSSVDPEEYPWGLRLSLETGELDKLGIKEMPAVGAEVSIMARGKIIEASVVDRAGADERSVRVQIQEMEMIPAHPKKSTAERMFGTSMNQE